MKIVRASVFLALVGCLPPATIDAILLTVEELACLGRHRSEGEGAVLSCAIKGTKAGLARDYLAGKAVSVKLAQPDGGP